MTNEEEQVLERAAAIMLREAVASAERLDERVTISLVVYSERARHRKRVTIDECSWVKVDGHFTLEQAIFWAEYEYRDPRGALT